MKWKNSYWYIVISFFLGVFVSYISLQWSFFDIKNELDIPALLLGVLTLIVGLYIATSLQKKLNRNQNQLSFLIEKFDKIWVSFNKYDELLSYGNNIDADFITSLEKDILPPLSFLKNIFNATNLDDNCIEQLETEIEELKEYLENLPTTVNIIDISTNHDDIKKHINNVNTKFSDVFTTIHNK